MSTLEDRQQMARAGLDVLEGRERQMWALRWGLEHAPLTLEQVAKAMGYSGRERVRQMEATIVRRLTKAGIWHDDDEEARG